MSPTLKYKKIIAVFLLLLGLASFRSVSADSCEDLRNQFTIQVNNHSVDTIQQLPNICTATDLANRIINILMTLAAIIAVGALMLGGFWYLTAAGNEEQSEKGRKAIMSSVIGLVVIIMAFAIVKITVNLLTSNVSSNAPAAAATSGGNTPPPSNNSPSGASAGTPLCADPSNMVCGLTQQQANAYDGNDHIVSQSNPIYQNNSVSGLSVSVAVNASDAQALAEVYRFCGSDTVPVAQLYVNGTMMVGDTFQGSGSGTWTAALQYAAVSPSDTVSVYICGHQLPGATWSPPR